MRVFPTHVGVYRGKSHGNGHGLPFSPHTWGCTAFERKNALRSHQFSPHTWGCTYTVQNQTVWKHRFPHTRGGVPEPR